MNPGGGFCVLVAPPPETKVPLPLIEASPRHYFTEIVTGFEGGDCPVSRLVPKSLKRDAGKCRHCDNDAQEDIHFRKHEVGALRGVVTVQRFVSIKQALLKVARGQKMMR
jgi:hypothetical protein